MIIINFNMSTTLPEAIFIYRIHSIYAKSVHKYVFCDYSFIIKALGKTGCGWIKKL